MSAAAAAHKWAGRPSAAPRERAAHAQPPAARFARDPLTALVHPPGPASQSGFTLLEAIVAMVIMATTLLALYAWLGSTTIGVQRARAVSEGLVDARLALVVVEAINPMESPTGSRDVGEVSVRWTATPIADRRAGVTTAGVAAPYDFALYDVEVETLRAGEPSYRFKVRRAGWVATQVLNMDDL